MIVDDPPDYNSLEIENAQELPPMQVCLSEDNLYEGSLGEVTKGWGSDLDLTPPIYKMEKLKK